ncbi:MAG TPA: hypothetical protein PK299_15425 [Anaerolineales bacterium]|nr:hypothetical protein [Anaerolineales bacterium]
MNQHATFTQMSRALSQELSAPEELQLELSLAQSETTRQAWQTMQAVHQMFTHTPLMPAPTSLMAGIRQGIALQRQKELHRTRLRKRWLTFILSTSTLITLWSAVALLLGGIALWWLLPSLTQNAGWLPKVLFGFGTAFARIALSLLMVLRAVSRIALDYLLSQPASFALLLLLPMAGFYWLRLVQPNLHLQFARARHD